MPETRFERDSVTSEAVATFQGRVRPRERPDQRALVLLTCALLPS
jgi:hypothetical protein